MMLWISLISYFSDISFSQGSVAMRLRCGGVFNKRFIANFLQIVIVKAFQKSVSIWWSYAWNTPDSFFSGHGVYIKILAEDYTGNTEDYLQYLTSQSLKLNYHTKIT